MAPQVQTLAQVMAELNPAYAGQQTVLDKQKALIPAKYNAQKTALGAEKVQGFNQINDQATGKGLSFSGIPIDEQATYLSTKYLPGIQKANADMNAEDLALQADYAKLNTEKTNKALGLISDQKSSLNAWNLQQAQIAASAAEGRANRAASAASSAPKAMDPNLAAISYLETKTGRDGFVSPQSFRTARDLYIQAGGDNKSFMDKYWRFTGANSGQANNKNWKSYYY